MAGNPKARNLPLVLGHVMFIWGESIHTSGIFPLELLDIKIAWGKFGMFRKGGNV